MVGKRKPYPKAENVRGRSLSGSLFDFSLDYSGETWTGASNLIEIARDGHFTDGDLPWELSRF